MDKTCKRIDLSKENMEEAFLRYLEEIFTLPEILNAKVRDVIIHRDTMKDDGRRAFEAGYHDCFSDVDLSVRVRLPKDGSVTAEDYMKRIDRFGVTEETALGWCYVPENRMYRMIFKNGMRYDFGFDFEFSEGVERNPGEIGSGLGEPELNHEELSIGDRDMSNGSIAVSFEKERAPVEENANWPMENVNRFWFVQIQALAKLYRRDYLISSHLANVNCNETLVMQMVLRDLEHGTNHHRYGYAEELEYVKALGKMPFQMSDATARRIADHLYAAALTYDRLTKNFYPGYADRSSDFFAIWNCYEVHRDGVSGPKKWPTNPVPGDQTAK